MYTAIVTRTKKSAESTQFNLRMPVDLIAALDDEVAEHQRARPGVGFTRSALIREVLYKHVRTRKEGGKR